VEELADREEGFVPRTVIPFRSLIPLSEIIAAALGTGQPFSKKVWAVYNTLLDRFGSEFRVLTEAPEGELGSVADKELVGLIMKNREGRIEVEPGYDGVYGHPLIGKGKVVTGVKAGGVKRPSGRQKNLSDF